MSNEFTMDIPEAERTSQEFKDHQKQFEMFAQMLSATLAAIHASVYGNFAAALIAALQAAIKTALSTSQFCGEFAKAMDQGIENAKQTEAIAEKAVKAIKTSQE